jgi:hypothetical protein
VAGKWTTICAQTKHVKQNTLYTKTFSKSEIPGILKKYGNKNKSCSLAKSQCKSILGTYTTSNTYHMWLVCNQTCVALMPVTWWLLLLHTCMCKTDATIGFEFDPRYWRECISEFWTWSTPYIRNFTNNARWKQMLLSIYYINVQCVPCPMPHLCPRHCSIKMPTQDILPFRPKGDVHLRQCRSISPLLKLIILLNKPWTQIVLHSWHNSNASE